MATGLLVGAPKDERAAFLLRCTSEKVVQKAGYPGSAQLDLLTARLDATTRDWTTLHQSGAIGLDLVMEEGTYQSITLEDNEPALLVRIDPGMERFGERLGQLMSDGTAHLAMPADSTAFGQQATSKRTHAGIGLELLSRLPRFEEVSLEETLDIRDELAGPLTRFRAAVVELAEGDESGASIETIWLSMVAPALQELDESVEQNGYLRRLTERLLGSGDGMMSMASIAIGISALHGIPEMLAASLGLALPALRAGWDRHVSAQDISKHRLYFMHEVKRRFT